MMTVTTNTVYNHNLSQPDIMCGQRGVSVDKFHSTCGMDVGKSVGYLPTDAEIESMIRTWLRMP